MRRLAQRGSILIAVIVALVILAAVSHMLILQQSERIDLISMEDNRQAAEYLAEAGLRHALWRVRGTTSNQQYPATVTGSLPDQGTYKATITPTSGTPISVISTGMTPTGQIAEVTRAYAVQCAGKTLRTAIVATYDSKGIPTTLFESSNGNLVSDFLAIDNSMGNANRARALIKFDVSSLPKGITYESSELMLDVQQHDSAMEGGTLFVNRLTKAYDSSRVSWTDATSSKDKWITPGADYTLVDEARTTIAPSVTTYTWTITPIVHAWVNNTLLNDGLIVRTNVSSSYASHKFRLKNGQWGAQSPRLIVKYCI